MPISGPSSYPATIDDFVAHWADVDAVESVTLPGGTIQVDLVAFGSDLENARDAVSDRSVDQQTGRAALTALITALQARLVEFNARVRGDLPGNPLVESLPEAFTVGEAESGVREALRKVNYIWTKVNALSPAPLGLTLPLTLNGDYALAAFTADRTALRAAYVALSNAEVDLSLARAERNKLQDVIYPILKSYRQKITGMARAHPEWVESLPRLTPEQGSTPAAVTAHATWNAPTEQAKITWNASTEADLEKFEVRGVAGDSYDTEDETVLATVLPDAAREFFTDFGLSAAGLTSGFKVYVVLHTGNEKGSDAVYVTRP